MQYTSATANKLLKKITAERDALLKREQKLSIFNCSAGEDEDKLRPEYDMAEYKMKIRTLNKQIMTIKHAINLANCNCKVPNADGLTVDQLLIVLPMKKYADTMIWRSAFRVRGYMTDTPQVHMSIMCLQIMIRMMPESCTRWHATN